MNSSSEADLAAARALAGMPASPAPKQCTTYVVHSPSTPFTQALSTLSPLVPDVSGHIASSTNSLNGSPAIGAFESAGFSPELLQGLPMLSPAIHGADGQSVASPFVGFESNVIDHATLGTPPRGSYRQKLFEDEEDESEDDGVPRARRGMSHYDARDDYRDDDEEEFDEDAEEGGASAAGGEDGANSGDDDADPTLDNDTTQSFGEETDTSSTIHKPAGRRVCIISNGEIQNMPPVHPRNESQRKQQAHFVKEVFRVGGGQKALRKKNLLKQERPRGSPLKHSFLVNDPAGARPVVSRTPGAGSKTFSPQSTASPNSMASPATVRGPKPTRTEFLTPSYNRAKASRAIAVTPTSPVRAARRNPCNCKKSKCLKLYCECFSAKLYCSGCNCNDCSNTAEHDVVRDQAIRTTLERNPNAFKPKISASPGVGKAGQGHTKGCHCKKSNCLKKYCECFLGEVYCGPNCKCLSCKNFEGSADLKRGGGSAAAAVGTRVAKPLRQGVVASSSTSSAAAALFQFTNSGARVKRERSDRGLDDALLVKRKCARATSENGGPLNRRLAAPSGDSVNASSLATVAPSMAKV